MDSWTSHIRVRYAETDKMGIVYHANYLIWFEATRIELLDAAGLPYIGLEKRGFLLPVLDAKISYIKPARFDDRLDITATITRCSGVRMEIAYEVRRGDELLCTGSTGHAWMSAEGTACRPPKEFLDRFRTGS